MKVLGIETTCDETACAVVVDGYDILSNVISSQIDIQKEFGGVVPELACRRHIDVIAPVCMEALTTARVTLDEIDRIAVAKGPGLIGALLIGLHFAKALSFSRNIPLVGINHVEAHLYASIMSHKERLLPALGVVLSGGHTSLVEIHEVGSYRLIGETVDDAIGEAFDKVAKMLILPYPGGPHIEKLAKLGQKGRFAFKGGNVKGHPLDFSFSGLKTAVLYAIRDQKRELSNQDRADIAYAFQEAAFHDVLRKIELALAGRDLRALYLGGGVTQNQRLRALLEEQIGLPILWPRNDLCLDNAAMIAGLGAHAKSFASLDLEPETRIPFHR